MLRELIDRLRARRRRELADEYGYLSDDERAEIDRLRRQHSPLGELNDLHGAKLLDDPDFRPPQP